MTTQEVYNQATDPDYRSGKITGISVRIDYEEFVSEMRNPPTNQDMCYVVVTADIEGSADSVVLHRDLIGVWAGDDRPSPLSSWKSTPDGVAGGKRDTLMDGVEPADGRTSEADR